MIIERDAAARAVPGPVLDGAVVAAMLQIASLDWRLSGDVLETVSEDAGPQGVYEGLPPRIELLSDGRMARLLAPIAFIRAAGDRWDVPAGAELDGASIPRAFWGLIGGPFEGRYRNASIVHDYYCVTQDRPWRDTHRMFYEAMCVSGVNSAKAKIMYYAVYRFGPRWPEGGSVNEALESETAALSAEEARVAASDAQAIVEHGLNLEEIDRLADARNLVAAERTENEAASSEGPDEAAEKARQLVIVGGSGTSEDLAAVTRRCVLLPAYVVDRFARKGVRIVACRRSVTDFETDLREVVPPGWEKTGKTWDDVPGAYFPGRKRVVIATIADANGGRTVPDKSSGLHGAADLMLHESLHGYDYATGHAVLADPRFLQARDDDLALLDDYERQEGERGLEETYAESGARYLAEPEAMRGSWPALFEYWQGGPEDREVVSSLDVETEAASGEGRAIGTAELVSDGSIRLDIRAEGEDGAIGHAVLTIRADEPAHAALSDHLYGADHDLESASSEVKLFIP